MLKYLLIALFTLMLATSCPTNELRAQSPSQPEQNRILVFSKTTGYRHKSIEPGKEALLKLGKQHGVTVDTTEDATMFTPGNLAKYDAVVFLSTSDSLFTDDQRAAFKSFIQNGGGYAGIHSASASEYDWPWYNNLLGAFFDNHPDNPNVRSGVINVIDSTHLATRHLPRRWHWKDEWYNFYSMQNNFDVLMTVDTDSYKGSQHPEFHPIAWYHEFDGGRSFYTAIGHRSESFSDELFLKHIWGGIEYAIGGL